MVQRSDDKGDKRSSGPAETGPSREAETHAANALRERIRQLGGPATARASDHAPPEHGLIVPSSTAPPGAEHSGVRTRPPEPRSTSSAPPLFGPPKLNPGPMSVPWPAAPRARPAAQTRVGLGQPPIVDPHAHEPSAAGLGWGSGDDSEAITADMQVPPGVTDHVPPPARVAYPTPRVGQPTPPTPRGVAPPAAGPPPTAHAPMDAYTLSTARTQPMPRVRTAARGGDAQAAARGGEGRAPRAPELDDERRRVELATTRKTQGLLRTPDASSAGRYSVRDLSAEYVDSGPPDALADTQSAYGDDVRLPDPRAFEGDPSAPAEGEIEGTRPRRSTPKQRVGHRRSTRPEIGHARERGTKRTDPGIRARTLRGGVGPGPLAPPAAPVPPPLPVDPGTVVVDPSLSVPPPPPAAALPAKVPPSSGYVPLPRDREAYEAFLRSAAGEHGGPPRARPSWAQQETALIPRDALQPPYEYEAENTASRRAWLRSVLGVVLIAVGGVTLWWTFFRDEPASPRAHEQAVPAARAVTLIATEPPGAEVLLDGAVIGNTPLEVTRPLQGESLYLVRMKNFEHQMVRVTNGTHNAIHITLQPVPEPPPAAAKR